MKDLQDTLWKDPPFSEEEKQEMLEIARKLCYTPIDPWIDEVFELAIAMQRTQKRVEDDRI